MKKILNYIYIVSIFLILLSFFLNVSNIIRLLIIALGIIVFIMFLCFIKKYSLIKIIIFTLCLIICTFVLDYLNVAIFDKTPIYSIKNVSSKSVITYDSLFYRVYNCENKQIIDYGYHKNYACEKEEIEKISINTFLENPLESYNKNKNKFIHLVGKINTVTGDSSITLDSYVENNELNGYVEFDSTKKVQINNLNIDPSKYYIYDLFEVIGRVDKYEENDDIIIITLEDAKIIDNNIYDDYKVVVDNKISFSKDLISDNIYYVGIDKIYYKYTEDIIYSLDYLLGDKRETIDSLIENVEYKIVNENDKYYSLENYDLLLCENNDVIFISKNIYSSKDYCENMN